MPRRSLGWPSSTLRGSRSGLRWTRPTGRSSSRLPSPPALPPKQPTSSSPHSSSRPATTPPPSATPRWPWRAPLLPQLQALHTTTSASHSKRWETQSLPSAHTQLPYPQSRTQTSQPTILSHLLSRPNTMLVSHVLTHPASQNHKPRLTRLTRLSQTHAQPVPANDVPRNRSPQTRPLPTNPTTHHPIPTHPPPLPLPPLPLPAASRKPSPSLASRNPMSPPPHHPPRLPTGHPLRTGHPQRLVDVADPALLPPNPHLPPVPDPGHGHGHNSSSSSNNSNSARRSNK